MNTFVIAATIAFPGLGHVIKGESFKGCVFAVSFSVPLWNFLLWTYVWTMTFDQRFSTVCLVFVVGVWALALFDIVKRTYFTNHEELEREKERLLRDAIVSHLRGEGEDAEAALVTALKLDREDPDVYFHLGAVLKSMDQKERARRAFRKSLSIDDNEKWRWEVETELARMA